MPFITNIKSVHWFRLMKKGWRRLREPLDRLNRKVSHRHISRWSAVITRPGISPVSVCFIGRNRGGTWAIRGEQMASMRSNWKATLVPSSADLDRFEVFCFVKHPIQSLINQLRSKGKVVIYDVNDSWAQPADGLIYTSVEQAREYFGRKWQSLGIDYFIFPNRQMQLDLGDLVKHSAVIYYHYWPNRGINTVRTNARVVAYEGVATYLGEWQPIMKRVCGELGLKFVVNPRNWSKVDIGVAVRGGEHDSFFSNSYKPNTKLANLYGSATPAVVGYKEVSLHETDSGDVRFFRTERELKQHLRDLLDYETRRAIHERVLQTRSRFSLSSIADELEQFCLYSLAQEKSDSMESAPSGPL